MTIQSQFVMVNLQLVEAGKLESAEEIKLDLKFNKYLQNRVYQVIIVKKITQCVIALNDTLR